MNRTRFAISGAIAAAGAIVATVAGPVSPALAAVDPCVQRVVVWNNAAFNMSYVLSDRTGVTTTPTDDYATNQSRATDLTFTDYAAGTDVRPIVSAVSGDTVTAAQFVSFCDNGQTATYTVTGTLNDYQITLIGG